MARNTHTSIAMVNVRRNFGSEADILRNSESKHAITFIWPAAVYLDLYSY